MSVLTKVSGELAKVGVKASIALSKNAPHIFFGVGVVSVLAGTVWAIVATPKADAVMDQFNTNIDRINESIKNANETEDPEYYYSLEEQRRDKRIVYGQMIKSMAGIYLPVVILETIGIGALCKSHFMFSKANAGLTAMCGVQARQIATYRQRIKNKIGDAEEEALWNGCEIIDVVTKETSENGVTTELHHKVEKNDPLSPFSFLISVEDNKWDWKDPYSILSDIYLTERTLNDKLARRKALFGQKAFLTMNEIAEAYGIAQRPEWATFVVYQNFKAIDERMVNVGVNPDAQKIEGTPEWKFVNKITDGIWLTPNIQGNIYDDIDTQYRIAGLKKAKGE